MRKLKRTPKPGRAGVIVPNGTLFGDGVAARINEELLKKFNLHTIVRLPNGVFAPYTGIPTNLLFFDRSGPTKEVYYYEQPLPEGRLGDYVIDDCYGASEKTTDDFSGTPVLRMGNIQNGQLNLNDLKYLPLSDNDRKKLLLIKGDIHVNRTNSSELVGKSAVFELDSEYAFASYLIRLRLNLRRAEPKLVAFYINSPAGRAYMFSERKQMTGQANVNAKKLEALPIALPTLPDQRRIVAHLNDLQAKADALKCLQNETAVELDAPTWDFRPEVLVSDSPRELRWLGSLWITWPFRRRTRL